MDCAHEIQRSVERRLSAINAAGVLRRASEKIGRSPQRLTAADVPALVNALSGPLRLYLAEHDAHALLAEIQKFGDRAVDRSATVDIVEEADVSRARQTGRQLAVQLGASAFVAQRIATAVSEVARNIHSYTPGGKVSFTADPGARVLKIVGEDRGAGISNLEEIMNGDYRSKTGMGLGLRGTKRLVDDMRVSTGPSGTRIELEVRI